MPTPHTSFEGLRPVPPPVDEAIDLRNFPKPWYGPEITESGWYLRMEASRPELIAIFWRLHAARWSRRGLGFDADPYAMAHLLHVSVERWLGDIYPALSDILALGDNGRLYLLPGLDACLEAWDRNRRNCSGAAVARAAQAANEAERRAEEAAAKAAAQAEREAQKAAKPAARKPPRSNGLQAAVGTPSGQVRPSNSSSPPPHPKKAEVGGSDTPAGGPETVAAASGGSLPERIIALYPAWPRDPQDRQQWEADARCFLGRLISEDAEAEGGQAILDGIYQQWSWLKKRRRPLCEWLHKRRWLMFRRGRATSPPAGQAPSQPAPEAATAVPGPGAGDEEWLAWAETKARSELASKPLQNIVSNFRRFDHWWSKGAPQGIRGRLSDELERRLGFKP